MKPVIIEHPLRTISLQCSDEPLGTLEQEAIEKYTTLHNDTYALKQLSGKLINDYAEAVATLQQCQQSFHNLQNEYVLLAPMLHYYQEGEQLTEEEAYDVQEDEKLCYDPSPLFNQLNEFKKVYYHYVHGVQALEKEHTGMLHLQEKLEAAFDVFDEQYFSPIIHNYAQMQIDTLTFDADFDDYRSTWSQLNRLSDHLCNTRNAFIELHNQLFGQMQALDKDLALLFDTIRKMNEDC